MGIFRGAAYRWGGNPGSGPNPFQWRNQFGTGFHDRMEQGVNGVYARLGMVLNGGQPGPIYPSTQPNLTPDGSDWYNNHTNYNYGYPIQTVASTGNHRYNYGAVGINNLNSVNPTPWNQNGGSNFNVGLHNSWILNARNGLSGGIYGQGQYSIPSYQPMAWNVNPTANYGFANNGAFSFV